MRALPVPFLAMVCIAGVVAVAAQTAQVRLESANVTAGQAAVIVTRVPAGVAATAVAAGPAVVAPVAFTGTGADQRVTVGPFVQPGTYTIRISAGAVQTSVTLTVAFPPSETRPSAADVGAAYRSAADALIESINATRTGVSRIPGAEPTLEETKRAMDDLQRKAADMRAGAADAGATIDRYGQLLNAESTASRESKDEFARLEQQISQVLDEQARQAREFGRDAEAPHADPCEAAEAASTALRGAQAMVAAMEQGGRGASRRAVALPTSAQWNELKPKLDALTTSGQAASYADAARMIDRAAGPNGLGGFTSHQCEKYTGDWSGTTRVEALDKGQAFYQLHNDWSAHVELAASRSLVTSGAEAPVRGTLTGRGTNFKVVNQLRVLYAGRPAKSIEYLTSDPTPDQIESATFVAVITGSIRGNQMSLKVQPAGVDYSGRVTGKLAAVVIPMASPVPLVQTFDVVFQGGVWQLTRAIGPSGATERPLTITSGGGKRLVQADIPRQLSTAGARGAFTTRIQLCAGCGS